MSRTLIIYRHGKSDWGAAYGSDHDRPLSKRGIKSAKLMGKFLSKSGEVPALAISSTALRAKQTLELSVVSGNWECDVTEEKKLYTDSIDSILELIKTVSDEYESLMLVGHEPKCSALTSALIGGGDIVFKTATMACIDFEKDSWADIDYDSGELRWLYQPSSLK